MIDHVRKLPGEAVFFFPFSVHGGDGGGETKYHYLTAHQMQLAAFMGKKMNGFYGGRLDVHQDELPRFFRSKWSCFLNATKVSKAEYEHSKKLLQTYFRNTDYSAAVIFRNRTSLVYLKMFRELFGTPVYRLRYFGNILDVYDISRLREKQIDPEAAKNIQFELANFDLHFPHPNGKAVLPLKELYFLGPARKKDSVIVLDKDGVQYGPYYYIVKGDYRVRITGENLDQCRFYCTSNKGKKKHHLRNLVCSPENVSYEVRFRIHENDVEFLTRNKGPKPARITQIEVTPLLTEKSAQR